jgi:hypothetical protein
MRRNKSLGWIRFRRVVSPHNPQRVLPLSEAAAGSICTNVGNRADRGETDFSNTLSAERQHRTKTKNNKKTMMEQNGMMGHKEMMENMTGMMNQMSGIMG